MGWFSQTDTTNKAVLKPSLAGGPHGVGDPEDKSLRKVELEVLIPQIMRDITRKVRDTERERIQSVQSRRCKRFFRWRSFSFFQEKCANEVEVFNKCAKREGLSVVFSCRAENDVMRGCMERWYTDPDFKEECTQKYLAERTRYRETGITKPHLPRNLKRPSQDELSDQEPS